MTPEGKLKQDVLEYLAIRGEWVIRMNAGKAKVRGGYFQGVPEGTADLLIMRPVPHWIELKAPKSYTLPRRAEKQFEFRKAVLRIGHRHCEARSVEDVMRFLNGVDSL